jgi:hypothetical protein
MPQILSRYATPMITGLFLVSLISGLALFLHIGPGGIHPMHEWLSLALILPFGLHIWRNWRPMVSYFKRAPMVIALALSVGASAVFVLPVTSEAGRTGGPPQFALAERLLQASVTELAPALRATPGTVGAALTAGGFTITDPDATLSDIAKSSGKTPAEAIAVLTHIPAR